MNALCFVLTSALIFPILGALASPVSSTPWCPEPLCAPDCELITGPDGCGECQCSTTTTVPTCPPPPPCARGCEAIGPDGCPTCRCPSCVDITCPPGTQCKINDSSCDWEPCFGKPYCAPIEAATDTTEVEGNPGLSSTHPTEATTRKCPKIKCAPVCRPATGHDGCPICHCPRTCKGIRCPSGTHCELVEPCGEGEEQCFSDVQCVIDKATSTITPTSSSTCEVCEPGCESSNIINNCVQCGCPSVASCMTMKCSAGYICVEPNVTCYGKACRGPGECVPTTETPENLELPSTHPTETTTSKCTKVKCDSNCRPFIGHDGCPVCRCPPACNGTCPPGTHCDFNDSSCSGDEERCFLESQCVPDAVTTPLTTEQTCEVCEPGCVSDFIIGNCFQCGCPFVAPCEVVDCREGFTCISKELVCKGATCRGPPKCVPITSTIRPPCPATPVSCQAPCVPDIGPDGCDGTVCACPRTCEDANCTANEECRIVNVTCIRAPCFPEPQCFPKHGDISLTEGTTEPTQETTLPERCRDIHCPAEFDCVRVIGVDGCPICRCPRPSCEGVTCDPRSECVLVTTHCEISPCVEEPWCVLKRSTTRPTCPIPVSCQAPCEPDIGPDGCDGSVCACPRTCEDVNCTANEECRIVEVFCVRAPCFPVPECFPKHGNESTIPSSAAVKFSTQFPIDVSTECPMIKCAPDCVPSTGSDGCPACDCPPRCEDDTCLENQTCVLEDVVCVDFPCFPVLKCVSKNPCKKLHCENPKVCRMRRVECKKAPCELQPSCD